MASMDFSGPDRRQSKRYAQQLVVQWQRQQVEPSEDWRYAFIRDISKGGLCFETGETVTQDELLCFKIKIHFSLWPFNCTGQVIRIRPLKKPKELEIGVIFVSIDPKDADLIDLLAWEQEQKQDPEEGKE